MLGLVGSVGIHLGQPPWRWLIPVAVLLLCALGLLVAALAYPVPGGVNGCEGPHLPPGFQRMNYGTVDRFLRDWSHAKHVRQQLWESSLVLMLPVLAVSAVGGFLMPHRLVKYSFGLALTCLVVVLVSARTVDPVYFGGGC